MVEITDVSLSKQTVNTGEKIVIAIGIEETVDFPLDFPFDFPIAYVGNGK